MVLILASASPRRKKILEYFAIPFTQKSSNFDERTVVFKDDPVAYVRKIAREKANAVNAQISDIVLAADTIVYKNKKLFHKPENETKAMEMLKELNGKSHLVITALALKKGKRILVAHEKTRVFFKNLPQERLKKYLKSFHLYDKAGAYAVQNGGSIIVKRIEGCFYNVMGLPIAALSDLLFKVGIDIWDHLKD